MTRAVRFSSVFRMLRTSQSRERSATLQQYDKRNGDGKE